jgi:uncharacterized metal-binding protein YceD (DUF177 family)
VRLGRKVDDRVDVVLQQGAADLIEVADVAPHERDPVRHVRADARVRQQVVRDEVVLRMPLEPVTDEVRADEACRAGDEDAHGASVRAGR